MRRKIVVALALTLLALTAPRVNSQALAATITGTVRDKAGLPLAGVPVSLSGEAQPQLNRQTVTDAEGRYRFTDLPPGVYSIGAAVRGFARQVRKLTAVPEAPAVLDFSFRQPAAGVAIAPQVSTDFSRDRSLPPTSSAVPPPSPPPAVPSSVPLAPISTQKPSTVNVLYATDRRNTTAAYGVSYSNDRSYAPLQYGIAQVSIPPDHRLGMLEAPSIWTLTFAEDPAKHIILVHTERRDEEQFFSDVNARASGKEIFVFVHGYNVTFADALRRTAQLAFDLQFKGAVVAYTWPSEEKLENYLAAEGTVDWSTPHLAAFLQTLANRSGGEKIHVVAHSMGNRLLARALNQVFLAAPSRASLFNHLVMAAADIDVDEFRQLEANLRRSTDAMTMYVSETDKALNESQKLHRFSRVGQGGRNAVLIPGTETVDATGVDASFLDHSYIGDSKTVIGDLWQLIACGWPAARRDGLLPPAPSGPQLWKLNPVASRRTQCQ